MTEETDERKEFKKANKNILKRFQKLMDILGHATTPETEEAFVMGYIIGALEERGFNEAERNLREEINRLRTLLENVGWCPDCEGLIKIRNPTGKCDHLYYPENKKRD